MLQKLEMQIIDGTQIGGVRWRLLKIFDFWTSFQKLFFENLTEMSKMLLLFFEITGRSSFNKSFIVTHPLPRSPNPTEHITILEPQIPSIIEFYVTNNT